ncbi:MAG TPA: hypothetical protein VE645_19300, partial [Pseudonocardiaceae bacterium]|nr:hypothetical protein [Pseudonocardiaceae bacterium]
ADAAAAFTRQDRCGSAHAATTQAHRLAAACEGTRTPALAAITAPLPLTDRERAAGGLSNRQIAQRLVVSIRTVENPLPRQHQTRHFRPRRTRHPAPWPLRSI